MSTRYSRRIVVLAAAFTLCAIAADPDVESLMRNGHWKRAREAAEAYFRSHPNDARRAYWLARGTAQL